MDTLVKEPRLESAATAQLDSGLVPLLIGVTGHRDLVPDELPRLRERVREFFEFLRTRFPDRPLRVLTPLAEGADRLVAEVALELDLELAVPLPMPLDVYMRDFATAESQREFMTLYSRASAVYELPVALGSVRERWDEYGVDRNRQYAQLGVFLCAHCHLLLALWDGKASNDLGGTAQVIRFHHDDVMAGYAESKLMSKQILVADDSDLVYHIVTSRNRPGGEPVDDLRPLSAYWLTADPDEPRTAELPYRYARVFDLTSRFNRDARKYQNRILAEGYSLIPRDDAAPLPDGARQIDLLFRTADWLAIFYQRSTLSALRITHALTLIMGLVFIVYSDIDPTRPLLAGFYACLAVALAVHMRASRGLWHSKYLEYRALAEGLRVQFYWAAAGVISENSTKFAHDNFLQKQDVDLGWIRNVMRVAGISCDVNPTRDSSGLEFALREWVGSDKQGGQLNYFKRKIAQYSDMARQMEQFGKFIAFIVMSMLVLSMLAETARMRTVTFVVLAVGLFLYALRESYTHKTAEKDLIKQYAFMYSILANARRRIDAAAGEDERRVVLRVLGEAALDEHAEWILRHRDRPLSQGGIWRMTG
jgi:hypothetical protein